MAWSWRALMSSPRLSDPWFWVSVAVALVAVGLLAAVVVLALKKNPAEAAAEAFVPYVYVDGYDYTDYAPDDSEDPDYSEDQEDPDYLDNPEIETYESEPDDYLDS